MPPMTEHEQWRFSKADQLNSEAGEALLAGDRERAVILLQRAAIWSPSAEGRHALRGRAAEAARMAHDSQVGRLIGTLDAFAQMGTGK